MVCVGAYRRLFILEWIESVSLAVAPAEITQVEPIYLDYQATAPLDPRVLEAMLPYWSGSFGNPHSSTHNHGIAAMRVVDQAREEVANLIGADPAEIIFTSGATEADNLLVRGAALAGRTANRDGIVSVSTEHKAVLGVIENLRREGLRTTILGVDQDGMLDVGALAAVVDERTSVVSVMAANNEIGVIQPIAAIGRACAAAGALLHSDAAQAAGKIPIDVRRDSVSLMSLSSHKLYGPMGIGAAFIAREAKRRVAPVLHGGGQEGGFRSGTLPVALCAGFGAACRLAIAEMQADAAKSRAQRDIFLTILRDEGVAFAVNGALEPRLPGNLNLSFPDIDAEALLMSVRDRMSIASGSACTAESLDPSHVVLALGYGPERAEEAVRIGFGRPTTDAEIVTAAQILAKAVAKLARVVYRPRLGGSGR